MQRGVEKESICASKLLFHTVMLIFRVDQEQKNFSTPAADVSNTTEEQFSGQLFLMLVISFETYNKTQWQHGNFQKK